MNRSILILALLAAGCSRGQKENKGPDAVALVRPRTVEAATLTQTLEAYGGAEIAPASERTVIAPAEAQVAALLVAPGDRVTAGQPVATLTPSASARLDLDRAQREAQGAEQAYARAQRLRAAGLASDAEVEAAHTAAGTASESARSLQQRSGGAGLKLTAPGAGVVESLAAAPGDTIAQGAAVMKIGDPRALRVRLGIEPAQAARVKPGATVRLSSLEGQTQVEARVESVDPRADAQTRLAAAIVRLPAGAGFAPGQPVRGEIAMSVRTNADAVPRQALLYDGEKPYLFVQSGGVAHRRDVTLGVEEAERVEIRTGVKPGEQVVVEGGTALSDGMAVREQPAARADAP